ncbi:MAG: hypothetical protein ABIA47_02390 [bacterium]
MYDLRLAVTYGDFERHLANAPKGRSVVVVNLMRRSGPEFTQGVASAKALISDCDHTILDGNHWDVVRGLVGLERARRNDEAVLAWMKSDRTFKSECEFIFSTVELMIEAEVTLRELQEGTSKLSLRTGAKELIESFRREATKRHIDDVCFVSYGLHDAIKARMVLEGLFVNIRALKLEWTDRGRLFGIDCDSVVVGTNKDEKTLGYMAERGYAANKFLVIADAPSDIGMYQEGTVNVMVLPMGDDVEAAFARFRSKGMPEMWPKLDAVIIGDSLEPLAMMRR